MAALPTPYLAAGRQLNGRTCALAADASAALSLAVRAASAASDATRAAASAAAMDWICLSRGLEASPVEFQEGAHKTQYYHSIPRGSWVNCAAGV
jgi:hypothetical protein